MKETYLIAITPPADIQKRIKTAQTQYHKTGPYHLPPHVTIYPPFNSTLPLADIAKLLKRQLATLRTQQLTWDSYGSFEGKNNVFYFKPDTKSTKFLKSVFIKTLRALTGHVSDAQNGYATAHHDYHPHITIAEHLSMKALADIKLQTKKITRPLCFFAKRVDIYQRDPNSKTYTKVRHVLLQKTNTH